VGWIFPSYELTLRQAEGKTQVWDIIRRKWILLSKEEWVRQHLIHFLIREKGVSAGRIAVEREIRYGSLRKRFDVVIFDPMGRAWMVCECKSPEIDTHGLALAQAARYNAVLDAPHLLITNGLNWLFFSKNEEGLFHHDLSGWPA
jgi:hypothetical protein